MPMPQSLPLALTGVPDLEGAPPPPMQLAQQMDQGTPPPSPIPPVHSFNQQAAQAQALVREQALRAAAEQAIPATDAGTILSALSGIAGNIAGAVTGQGAVGNPGTEMAQQLYGRNLQRQQEYREKVKAEEARIHDQQKERQAEMDKQVMAQSLVPLASRIPDSDMKSAILSQARSNPHGAYMMYNAYVQDALRNQRSQFDMAFKRGQEERADKRVEQAQQGLDLRAKAEERQSSEAFARRFQTQRNAWMGKYEKSSSAVEALLNLEAALGGVDSAKADEVYKKLALLRGVGAAQRGDEDTKLASNMIIQLYNFSKTKDFGSQFTDTERKMFGEGAGFAIGAGPAGNVFNSAEQIKSGLVRMRDALASHVNTLDGHFDAPMIAEIEASPHYRDKIMTAARFHRLVDDARAAGGVSLSGSRPPDSSVASQWGGMTREQKTRFMRKIREQANGR